jgi:molecular chaperone DnaJ
VRRSRSFNEITHYEILGVPASASQQEIRGAYRRLARRHHPDHDADDRGTMAALNDAYHVLRNPGRRAAYDAELAAQRNDRRTTVPRRSTPPPRASLVVVDAGAPARYPWKLAVAAAAIGAVVVLFAAALSKPAEPARPDNVLEHGSCVAIEANGDAREVNCAGTDGDLVVEELIPFDGTCPPGLAAHRDRQGMGFACVSQG